MCGVCACVCRNVYLLVICTHVHTDNTQCQLYMQLQSYSVSSPFHHVLGLLQVCPLLVWSSTLCHRRHHLSAHHVLSPRAAVACCGHRRSHCREDLIVGSYTGPASDTVDPPPSTVMDLNVAAFNQRLWRDVILWACASPTRQHYPCRQQRTVQVVFTYARRSDWRTFTLKQNVFPNKLRTMASSLRVMGGVRMALFVLVLLWLFQIGGM